jgi:hypothetical protein
VRRLALALALLPALAPLWPCQAATAQGITATLSAAFSPLRLGRRTTLDFGFSFSAPASQLPPPLTQIELLYPNNLGIALNNLGLETCTEQVLEDSGLPGCPANSVMGYGVVLTGVVIGSTRVSETAPITILRAPDQQSRIALLFFSEGTKPVSTTVIFSGLLLPALTPFGGRVNIGVPLVPTLPGAPDISVVHLQATLGPKGVTYYEKAGGLTLAFHPRGILLPPACPRRGLQFAASFAFADGTHASASTAVHCPRPRRR